MIIEFRRASGADLPAMLDIIAQARSFLGSQGHDQWQDGYPQPHILTADIEAGNAWLLTADGRVVATAALIFADEPDYASIRDGQWGSTGRYAALHRVALHDDVRGQGLGAQLIKEIENLCRKAEFYTIRVDTHPENLPMQHLLTKKGFVRRGTITLSLQYGGTEGAVRWAYDKIL
ncbi:MAG: GNAT family N-acetyltransferase [Ruminococcaceae bacterium]|mgnify:CR=1 FL=1|nr:GNAT family N-acetyltransferase [Oscillospiraceae bacterium]